MKQTSSREEEQNQGYVCEGQSVRKSSRQKRLTENFKEMLQEIKEQKPSNKKSDQKMDKYQQKKIQEQKKVYEFGYMTDWLDCLYPHDNGQTFDLQIQFCVLKPKKPVIKKQKKEQTEEGIMSLIQNLLTNLNQNPDQARRLSEQQIQRVQTTNEGIVVYHPYFKKIEYQSKKPQQVDNIETTSEMETLKEKFDTIKKTFRPLILI